jgi:hypothetical protein
MVLRKIKCGLNASNSGFIKGGEFLDYLSGYELLRKDSAAWTELLTLLMHVATVFKRSECYIPCVQFRNWNLTESSTLSENTFHMCH